MISHAGEFFSIQHICSDLLVVVAWNSDWILFVVVHDLLMTDVG